MGESQGDEEDLPIDIEQEIAGGNEPIARASWAWFPDDRDFLDWAEGGHLRDERVKELLLGQDPTPEEIELFRESEMNYIIDVGMFGVGIVRVSDRVGSDEYFAAFFGDDGYFLGSEGPFGSAEEAKRALQSQGKAVDWVDL